MTFKSDPDKTHHYLPGQRPYIECTINERKIHARVLGWQGDMILIEYPPRLITKFSHGQRKAEWIHKSEAKRIRSEDSVWGDLEDDYAWHHAQDERISFRPDPWNIYEQEFPDSGMNHSRD